MTSRRGSPRVSGTILLRAGCRRHPIALAWRVCGAAAWRGPDADALGRLGASRFFAGVRWDFVARRQSTIMPSGIANSASAIKPLAAARQQRNIGHHDGEAKHQPDTKGQQGNLGIAHPLRPPSETRNLPVGRINTAPGAAPMPKKEKR